MRASSSLFVPRPGGAAWVARLWTMVAVFFRAASVTVTFPVWLTSELPAPAISALTQTVSPSYWLPCTSIDFPFFLAWAIIWSQVKFGPGLGTWSLRYQSSWVLLVKGSAQTWPLYR